jgi:hypothetical protein
VRVGALAALRWQVAVSLGHCQSSPASCLTLWEVTAREGVGVREEHLEAAPLAHSTRPRERRSLLGGAAECHT